MLPPMKRPLPPMELNRPPLPRESGLPPHKPTSGLRSKRMNWLMVARDCIGDGDGRRTAVGAVRMAARLDLWQMKNGLASIDATAVATGGG